MFSQFVDRRLRVFGRDVGLPHLLSNLIVRVVQKKGAVGVGF